MLGKVSKICELGSTVFEVVQLAGSLQTLHDFSDEAVDTVFNVGFVPKLRHFCPHSWAGGDCCPSFEGRSVVGECKRLGTGLVVW